MIYFIQEKEEPYRIKIGYSKDATKRIAVLSATLPQQVEIIKIIPGDIEDEKWFHDLLKQFRVSGKREWYHPDPDLLDFIETGDLKFAS